MAAVTSPNQSLKTSLKYLLLVVVALVFVFPIVFMAVSSFKPDQQLLRDTASFRAFLPVGDISLDNYFAAFRRAPGGNTVPVLFGRYEDEFIRENGTWKILRRTDIPTIPTAEEYGPILRVRGQILDQNIKAAEARAAKS